MRFIGQSNAEVSMDLGAERNLLVRKVLSRHVYYNDGNSLPVFSIPSSWGVFGKTWEFSDRNGSDFFSLSANRAIDGVSGENGVCARHVIKAELLHSGHAKSRQLQSQELFVSPLQDDKNRGKSVLQCGETLKS